MVVALLHSLVLQEHLQHPEAHHGAPCGCPGLGSRVPVQHYLPASYLQVLGALGAVLHSPALFQGRAEVGRDCFLQLVQVAVYFLQPCQELAALN